MIDHVLVRFGDLLECSDAVWARNQYSAKNIFELHRVVAVYPGPEHRAFSLQINEATLQQEYRTKICDACRSAILWDRIVAFQNRLDDIETRLNRVIESS